MVGGVIMNKKELIKEIKKISEPIAESLNYELVDVEYIKESGSFYLRVFIDKEGGVTLDDCQMMSEQISNALDKKDPIKSAYYLEVSSPGLDRPLKTERDLERNLGKDIEISLFKAIEGNKKIEGNFLNFNEANIIVNDSNNKEISIPRELISVIKLAIKF